MSGMNVFKEFAATKLPKHIEAIAASLYPTVHAIMALFDLNWRCFGLNDSVYTGMESFGDSYALRMMFGSFNSSNDSDHTA